MRADMGKVLVERPRLKRRSGDSRPGKGYQRELQRSLAAEASPPSHERLKHRYGHSRKFFNENLAPLRRFLESNVGRPWNKVYAEICKHVDRGNVVQKHILTHLFDYVVTQVVLIDGKPCRVRQGRGGYESLCTSHNRQQWFVCPKSGLLRRSRYVRRTSKQPQPPRRVVLNKTKMCLFLNGQWELVTVAPMPGPPQNPCGYDVVRKRRTAGWPPEHANAVRFYGAAVYALSRRPLSRVELLALPIPIEWLP